MCVKNLIIASFLLGISVEANDINVVNQNMGQGHGGMMRHNNGAMFEQHKSMLMQNHQQRIQILQNSYNCISAATNRDTLRACEMNEKQSLEEMRAQFKQQMESMKQQNGNRGPMQPTNEIQSNPQEPRM